MRGRIWIVAIVAGALGALEAVAGPALGLIGLERATVAAILPLEFYAAGVVAAVLLPEDVIGHRFLTVGSVNLMALALSEWGTVSEVEFAWALNLVSQFLFWLGVVAVYDALARFPDGGYAMPAARSIAVISAMGVFVLVPIAMLTSATLPSLIDDARMNPIHITALDPAAGLTLAAVVYLPGLFVIGFWLMLRRYRQGTEVERRRLRWPIVAATVTIVGLISGDIVSEMLSPAALDAIFIVFVSALPAALLIGLLQGAREDERLASVEASRRRIATAAVEERRRIERDLHDGAQQHLLALLARVELARQGVEPGSDVADEMTQIAESVREVHRELRELARGIYPTVLSDRGLAEAIASAVDRLPLRAQLDVAVPIRNRRFPQPIEGAAYLFVLEGLTNVMKHADADRAGVRLASNDGRLEVAISDNGRGFDPEELPPGALDGLRDRLAAVGGSVRIDSQPGGGTQLVGTFPVA